MNKNKFLTQLNKNLQALNKTEREEIINFYEERFEKGVVYEGKTEQEVVNELEEPDVIAKNVYEEYGINADYILNNSNYHIENENTNNVSDANADNNELVEKNINNNQGNFQNENSYYKKSKFNVGKIIVVILLDILVLSSLLPALLGIIIALGTSGIAMLPLSVMPYIPDTNTYTILGRIGISLASLGLMFLLIAAMLLLLRLFIKIMEFTVNIHYNAFTNKAGRNIRFKTEGRKTRKIFIKGTILGMLLFTGAIVVLVLNYSDFKDNFKLEHIEAEEYKKDIDIDGIWSMNINIDMAKVDFKYTDLSEIKVIYSYYEKDEIVFDINNENKMITIEQNVDYWKEWYNDMFHWVKSDEITIYLPKDLEFKNLSVDASNASLDLNLENSKELESVNIKTSNGKINVSNVTTSYLRLDTSNGSITLTNVVAKKVYTETSNGSINFSSVKSNDIYSKTTNGRIEMTNVSAITDIGSVFNIKSSNGSIILTDIYIKEVFAKTSNGNITFNNQDQAYSFFKRCLQTSNGDIKGSTSGSIC